MPKGQKTRERIVAEAASLFNQRGFEGTRSRGSRILEQLYRTGCRRD